MRAVLEGGPRAGAEIHVGPTRPEVIALPPHGAYVRTKTKGLDPAVYTWVEWQEEDHGAFLVASCAQRAVIIFALITIVALAALVAHEVLP